MLTGPDDSILDREPSHRMKTGDKVLVRGQERLLVCKYPDIPGGWLINKPVAGRRMWKEKDMQSLEC